MPVVFIIAIAVVLVGVYLAATGRGGEMAYAPADHAPIDLGPVSAADIALVRPPTALWGYNMQVTDEALDRIARAMRERDVRIAVLQQQLADLEPGAVPAGAHTRHDYADPALTPEDGFAFLPEAGYASEEPYNPEARFIADASHAPTVWPDAEAPQHYAALTEPDLPPVPEEPVSPAGQVPTLPDIEPAPESPAETTPDPAAEQTTEPLHAATDEAPDDRPLAEGHLPADGPETIPAAVTPVPVVTSATEPQEAPHDPADPEDTAEPEQAAQPEPFTPHPSYSPAAPPPQTRLILKASAPKDPAEYAPTQPSPALESHEATQPSPVLPSADDDPQAPYDTQGAQGSYDTHGWRGQQEAPQPEAPTQPEPAVPAEPSQEQAQ